MIEFYTISEITKILRVSRATVDKMVDSGALPCFIFGGVKRIPKDGFEAFIKNRLDDQQGEAKNRRVVPIARLNR
jgi:excisionase family DNA binding protein